MDFDGFSGQLSSVGLPEGLLYISMGMLYASLALLVRNHVLSAVFLQPLWGIRLFGVVSPHSNQESHVFRWFRSTPPVDSPNVGAFANL